MAQPAQRSLGRMSEIAQVAVRHGFGYFFARNRLTDLLPWTDRVNGDGAAEPSERGRRLREMLDELGPTFVKFGQLLSTRPDIVPAERRQVLVVDDRRPPQRPPLEHEPEAMPGRNLGDLAKAADSLTPLRQAGHGAMVR